MITIIMPSYKRDDFLMSEKHPTLNLAKLKIVKKLIIIYQDSSEKISESIYMNIEKLNLSNKVEIQIAKKNSLNNRFDPSLDVSTDCILSVDDDYLITEDALHIAFQEWIKDENRLIGFVPRFISESQYHGNSANSAYNEIGYNSILTGGAIFHKKFLEIYYSDTENLSIVDKYFNGEDIVFNFIHSNVSKKPPLYVHDDRIKTWKKSQNALSKRADHRRNRIEIFKLMKSKYGNVLKENKNKVVSYVIS